MNFLTSNTRALPYIQVLLTLVVLAYVLLVPQVGTLWLISFLIYCVIGCFGISIGYHRLLTHRSFKTNRFWEVVCTAIGILAFTGSSIGWVGVHRQHHKFSDKDGDPHSPVTYGAKMLIAKYDFEPTKWAIRYLITDKFHLFVHKYYFGIVLAWLGVWALVGFPYLMHIAVIPGLISIWISTVSNYMNHRWGYKNFKTSDNSRNLWINAIFTFGEGWHNNHHARPGSYTFQVKWWEFDIGALIVRLIKT